MPLDGKIATGEVNVTVDVPRLERRTVHRTVDPVARLPFVRFFTILR
ncbi:hypothetical protein [Amycolatopsis sp. cmx-4-83]